MKTKIIVITILSTLLLISCGKAETVRTDTEESVKTQEKQDSQKKAAIDEDSSIEATESQDQTEDASGETATNTEFSVTGATTLSGSDSSGATR